MFSCNLTLSPINVAEIKIKQKEFAIILLQIFQQSNNIYQPRILDRNCLMCSIFRHSSIQWSEAPSVYWQNFLCLLILQSPQVTDSRYFIPLFLPCLQATRLLPLLVIIVQWSLLQQAQKYLQWQHGLHDSSFPLILKVKLGTSCFSEIPY